VFYCVKHIGRALGYQEDRDELFQAVLPRTKRYISLCACTLEKEDEFERVKQVRALFSNFCFDKIVKKGDKIQNIAGV